MYVRVIHILQNLNNISTVNNSFPTGKRTSYEHRLVFAVIDATLRYLPISLSLNFPHPFPAESIV